MHVEITKHLQRDFSEIEDQNLPWEALRGKKILCTGGTGFLMRYFVQALCWLNDRKGLRLSICLPYRKKSKPFMRAHNIIHWIEAELTDPALSQIACPDIIIHAASPANQKAVASDPAGVVETNILATRSLLECARINQAVFLYFSSGEVYSRKDRCIAEDDFSFESISRMTTSFYGICKATGELLCDSYRTNYDLDCRIVRPFSIYGPGESLQSGRCFTDFLSQALQGRPIQVTGPGTQIRSYCYLSDFTSGLLHVLLKGVSDVYNLGNEDNVCSIYELAEQFSRFSTSKRVTAPLYAPEKSGDTDSFLPDTGKLRKLGWNPRVDLLSCIKRSLDSYKI